MPFATNPFQLPPVRTNELKESQLVKEINSLEANISRLQSEIIQIQSSHGDVTPLAPLQEPSVEKCTSKFYKTTNLPNRFERPDMWSHNAKEQHKSYTTTTNTYGKQQPTVHEMPTQFRGLSSKFSSQLHRAGPYRNFSLNI
jgi:t-SNARE complex subunit (syntaxin)